MNFLSQNSRAALHWGGAYSSKYGNHVEAVAARER